MTLTDQPMTVFEKLYEQFQRCGLTLVEVIRPTNTALVVRALPGLNTRHPAEDMYVTQLIVVATRPTLEMIQNRNALPETLSDTRERAARLLESRLNATDIMVMALHGEGTASSLMLALNNLSWTLLSWPEVREIIDSRTETIQSVEWEREALREVVADIPTKVYLVEIQNCHAHGKLARREICDLCGYVMPNRI